MRDDIVEHADGSVDLYFGPALPRHAGERLDRDAAGQRLVHLLGPLRTDAASFERAFDTGAVGRQWQ
jgi:hypothetical protein